MTATYNTMRASEEGRAVIVDLTLALENVTILRNYEKAKGESDEKEVFISGDHLCSGNGMGFGSPGGAFGA